MESLLQLSTPLSFSHPLSLLLIHHGVAHHILPVLCKGQPRSIFSIPLVTVM